MSSVLVLGNHLSYHLYQKETDMRNGFNQLCGMITNEFGKQVTLGDAFILVVRFVLAFPSPFFYKMRFK